MKISQTFSRMRGIPLKLGQVLRYNTVCSIVHINIQCSMQEEHLIPRVITQALERAQKSADIMPKEQLYEVLARELGSDWRDKFEYFDMHPIGAASIGQVHRVRTKDGIDVAVKIQYPGVAQSINSDLNSVRRLLVYPGILPRSFFTEDILRNISNELLEECDYITEARKQTEFRQLLLNLKGYYAPRVIEELSTRHVLAQEFIEGVYNYYD
jgi:aarF domain-containing kinase